MNKPSIFINTAKENWVVDRFIDEWNQYNYKQSRSYRYGKKIIWMIAPWAWKSIPKKHLENNQTLCTIHHIDEEKFDEEQRNNFFERDEYVDYYHVISKSTFSQVSKLTKKPIRTIPFWVNQNIWHESKKKDQIKKKYQIDNNSFLIGSFQRDTEGVDLISPKLSKGPDRFVEIVNSYKKQGKKITVILTGKRRQFIINSLKKYNIEFKYFEMASFERLNNLYNILDLYIVSSRVEGGPQSILECAQTKTPIISTDVGIASEILSPESIFTMENYLSAKPNVEYAFQNVQKYLIPEGFEKFNLLMSEINES